jgi:hypothetical protein
MGARASSVVRLVWRVHHSHLQSSTSLRLPKTSSAKESFGFRRECAGNHYVSPGRFEKLHLQPALNSKAFLCYFRQSELKERIHLPQVSAAQELQIKAQTRLASLMEEKLVTRISVLSTLLGAGKTTERLLVRISIETHKASPDFDQTAADNAKNRIKQALGEIGCDVFIETDR